MDITIKKRGASAKINTHGAHLFSLKDSEGIERMWRADERFWNECSPVLFPTCGSLLNEKYTYKGKEYRMGGHGFAYSKEWLVEQISDDRVKLSLTDSEETLAIYPFSFKLTAEFIIHNDSLNVSFTVENRSRESLPYMFGWHPGFELTGESNNDSTVELPGKKAVKIHKLTNGKFASPEGTDFELNDSKWTVSDIDMDLHKTLVLTEAGNRAVLTARGCEKAIDFTWSNNIPVFCMWKIPDPEATYICLEPWTNMPNDGITPENFETRRMVRLPVSASAVYAYKIKLIG